MGKRAEAEISEVEAPTKKAKKAKTLIDTVAEGAEDVDEEKRKRKEEKKLRKLAAAAEEEAAPEAAAEGAEETEEGKRKRKEEKKLRKQATAAASAAAEAQAKEAAPKKRKNQAGTAATVEKEAENEAEKDADSSEKTNPMDDELTVFVGGLLFTCTADALRKHFSKCGEVKSLKIPGKKKGRGIAFITYTNKEGVEKALKLNGADYEGRTLRVNQEKRPEKEVKVHSEKTKGIAVFVGGLPWNAEEAVLRKDFGECGEIESFKLPLNEEGKPRGFAFITYKTQEGVDKALEFEGTDYGGRTLTVNKKGDGKGKDKAKGEGKGKGKGKGKDKGKDKGKKGKGKAK